MTTETHPRRPAFRLALDVALAVTFALLLDVHILGGLAFHEVAGTAIGFAFALHVALNWGWVTQVTPRILQPSLPARTRVGYLLNASLLLGMGFVIVSGLLISRVVFPGLRVDHGRGIQAAHITVAFLALGVVGVHVGLHWAWLASTSRRLVASVAGGSRRRRLGSLAVLLGLLVAAGWAIQRSSKTAGGAPEVAGEPVAHPPEAPPSEPVRSERAGHRGPGDRGPGGRRHGRGFPFGTATPWGVAGFFLSILAVFAAATVGVERWLGRRRERRSFSAAGGPGRGAPPRG